MTIVIAGGSGFLGRELQRTFEAGGHAVRVLTRRPAESATQVQWLPDGSTGPWRSALADADVVVNLTGEGIADKRWTRARKQILHSSRILPARSLARALHEIPGRQRLLISISAIGYYGAHGDETITEDSAPGSDFLAQLAVEWEREAAAAASATTRVAIIRTGIVLHPSGGALKTMLLPFRFGVGGPLGSGRQYWSWIHLHDWVALVAWLAESARQPVADATAGPRVSAYNATAPHPVTNAEFARTLGRVLHRPALLPAPGFALRIVLGEFSQFLTTGARVLPARAEREGFSFRYPHLEGALKELLARRAA
jgi:uncharacterized protein (TIGR01777 family)